MEIIAHRSLNLKLQASEMRIVQKDKFSCDLRNPREPCKSGGDVNRRISTTGSRNARVSNIAKPRAANLVVAPTSTGQASP